MRGSGPIDIPARSDGQQADNGVDLTPPTGRRTMSELEYKLKMAMSALGRGKVSRRDFMQLALAAGLTVVAADKLYISAARAQGKPGGFARFGLAHGATTDNLDPASWPDTFTQTAFGGAMSNNLTEVDAKGNVMPELAESFEHSDGAKK